MDGIALLSAAGVVADCGYDEVRAIRSNHAGLRQTTPRIRFLDCGVNGQSRYDEAEGQVERDEELVQRASVAGEESVHDARQGNGSCIKSSSRPDEDPLPPVRPFWAVLPILQAGFAP